MGRPRLAARLMDALGGSLHTAPLWTVLPGADRRRRICHNRWHHRRGHHGNSRRCRIAIITRKNARRHMGAGYASRLQRRRSRPHPHATARVSRNGTPGSSVAAQISRRRTRLIRRASTVAKVNLSIPVTGLSRTGVNPVHRRIFAPTPSVQPKGTSPKPAWKDQMRIGITCYPTYGGSGVVATELGIELAAQGHEVHFISYSQPFRLSGRDDGIYYHEVPVSSYPLFEFPPYDLALASRMAEVAEFCKLDLLHVHYAIPHSVSALLARQMLAVKGQRLPFVTTLHGTDITLVGLDRSYLPITRYSIQESDGVTSISSYLKDKTVVDFGISRPIEVIPNFVNCDVYTPIVDDAARAAERLRFAAPDEALLLHLSNFRPVKRVVDVVKIFARVVEQIPARLVLIG